MPLPLVVSEGIAVVVAVTLPLTVVVVVGEAVTLVV